MKPPLYFADIAAQRGDNDRAAILFGVHLKAMAEVGLRVQPTHQSVSDRLEARLREELGDQKYEALWERGHMMTLEEGLAYALADKE